MAVIKGRKKAVEPKPTLVIPTFKVSTLLGKARRIRGRVRRGGS